MYNPRTTRNSENDPTTPLSRRAQTIQTPPIRACDACVDLSRAGEKSADRSVESSVKSSSEISSASSATASKIGGDREEKKGKNKSKGKSKNSVTDNKVKHDDNDNDNVNGYMTDKNDITGNGNDEESTFHFDDDDYAREHHAFGEVELSVTRISPPPSMEVTVNRRWVEMRNTWISTYPGKGRQ